MQILSKMYVQGYQASSRILSFNFFQMIYEHRMAKLPLLVHCTIDAVLPPTIKLKWHTKINVQRTYISLHRRH